MCKKVNLGTDLTLFTKNELNMNHRTKSKTQYYKLQEGNIEENLDGLGYGNAFIIQHHRYDLWKK